jgi:hypothetical protein
MPIQDNIHYILLVICFSRGRFSGKIRKRRSLPYSPQQVVKSGRRTDVV